MKRWLSASMATGVALTVLLSGCSKDGKKESAAAGDAGKEGNAAQAAGFNKAGLPIVKDKVTLKIVSPKAALAPNYDEMDIFKQLEKETNVHVEWTNVPDTDYQEKKNLILASSDLPDAFYGSQFSDYELVSNGESGTIVPLEDLIDKYAPNIKALFDKRPDLKALATAPDGHIYGLPIGEEMGIGADPFFYSLNTAWLKKLGLSMPATIDELHDVLVAFKTKDPNGNGKADEIPLSFMNNGWCMDIGDFFAAFGVPDNLDHRIVRDGKVMYTAVQPEFKEALKTYHSWYEEGLIDPESFTQQAPQYLAKGKTPDETLGSYVWWETEEVVGPDRAKDYALVPPLAGPTGKRLVGRANGSEVGRNAFVITKKNEHPEITMRWIDQQYEPYMAAQIHWGPIGVIYKKDDSGMLVNLPLPEGTSMGEYRQKVAPNGAGVITKDMFGTIVDMEPRAKQRIKDLNEIYVPYMEKEQYPNIFFNPDELDKINQIEPDLKEFVNTTRAKFLVDGFTDKEWDDYVAQVKSMGLDDLLATYQAGLDRYNDSQK